MKLVFATTEKELADILELRYKVLRAPWQQSAASATDDIESISFNAYMRNTQGQIIACGRLQKNASTLGQIRYMAVAETEQGKGLGKLILLALEDKAKEIGLNQIELQARENAVQFYKQCGYNTVSESFKLWELIQHYLMVKKL
jgi:predicted GNAT family N-acyltransferase